MKRIIYASALAMACFAVPEVVMASGDYGCYPQWRLANPNRSCSNTAIMAPGNDTRVNLLYLLRDRARLTPSTRSYPKPDYGSESFAHVFLDWDHLQSAFYAPRSETIYAAASGSRCDSRQGVGDAFRAALTASKGVSASEREALTAAREQAGASCNDGGGTPVWPQGVASVAGRDFLGYLQSADAFYAGRFDEARDGFTALRRSKDPWLAETAAYMIARNELVAAQTPAFDKWGDYGGPSGVDKAAVERGQEALAAYLEVWPAGRYADSARGLTRRALWLAGDAPGLSRAYGGLLDTQDVSALAAPALVQEIDNKLLFAPGFQGRFDAPLLLATWDLMRMRKEELEPGETPYGDPPITAAEIAAQESVFKERPDLYGFVQASHAYYIGSDYRRVTALIPDDARQSAYTPLAFSRQMLRGMALEALNDRNAAGFWLELLGGAKDLFQRPVVEMALALNWERHGKISDVFAKGSPITEPALREILLQQAAGPDLLRLVGTRGDLPQHERDVAAFTLLYKQLARARYADFNRDTALVRRNAYAEAGVYDWSLQDQENVPVGLFTRGKTADAYSCPFLYQTTEKLAANPKDPKALICLGEFYRLNGFDELAINSERRGADELGGAANGFTARPITRAALYNMVIADPTVSGEDKAYALYRAIWCYGPSGNNSCDDKDAPKSQRQGWFQQLKRDYPASRWAKDLKYYW